MTAEIMHSCTTKNKLYEKYFRHRSAENYNSYKRFRNRLTSVIRLAKNTYYRKLFADCNNNIKSTWKSINSLIRNCKSSSGKIDEILHDGETLSDSKLIGDVFNDFFTNIVPWILLLILLSTL